MKKSNLGLAPIILTIMLMSPMVIMQNAHARQEMLGMDDGRDRQSRDVPKGDQRGRDNQDQDQQGRGDRNRGTWNRGDYRFDVRDDDQTWRRSFVGRPSFQLFEDIDLRNMNQSLKVKQDMLDNLENQRESKAKEYSVATAKTDKLEKDIKDASDLLTSTTINKIEIQKQIQSLNAELPALQTAVQLADAAATQILSGLNDANAKLADAKTQLTPIETACTAAPTPDCQAQVKNLKDKIAQLDTQAKTKSTLSDAAQKDLAAKKQNLAAKNKSIADNQAALAQIDQDNLQRANQIVQLKPLLLAANADEARILNDLNPIEQRLKRELQQFMGEVAMREKYRNNLIYDVLQTNLDGARVGAENGTADGADSALKNGTDNGRNDGNRDGTITGTREGQERDYKRGADQGDGEGSARGQKEGDSLGSAEGRRTGNSEAGTAEGFAHGTARAQSSDAAQVGQQQGKTAGFAHSVKDGDRYGSPRGEEQGIQKFENVNLPTQTLDGEFAGSFDRKVPDYGEHRGGRYHTDNSGRREILRKAYNDGYDFRYAESSRAEYLRLIDGYYGRAYDDANQAARTSAYERNYEDQFNQGRAKADGLAYNREFPVARKNAFDKNRAAFNQNPERDSADYTGTYNPTETSTYASVYESIRNENYTNKELETYNANLLEQTEIFRNKRFDQVSKVYAENDVLLYKSSEVIDGGINQIAAKDGIFQPGEIIFHNISISNFGNKDATQVKVTSNDGTTSTIAKIPARTTVTIRGAAKGSIPTNSSIGSVTLATLRVSAAIKADAKIQGRYFDSVSQGILKMADQKQLPVNYPIVLSGLTTNSQLLLNEPNGLKISVTNQSNREYKGQFKIVLTETSGANIVTKTFDDLSAINGTINLTDAKLLVQNEKDIYSPIAFKAYIHCQGVKIGELSREFTTMAKAPFIDKADKPIVITNSDLLASDLLRTIEDLGGMSALSVLDLSLSSLNAAALAKGLQNRTAIVVDNRNGNVANQLQQLMQTSVNTTFVLVDDYMNAGNVAKTLPAFAEAITLPVTLKGFGKKTVTFTNPLRANGLKGSNMLLQATNENYVGILPLANQLALSTDGLIARAKGEINKGNFGVESLTLELLTTKALAEIANISRAYDKSGGIFSRDGKFADMVENDTNLIINKMKVASNTGISNESLGIILSAIALRDGVSKGMSNFEPVSKEMMSKISNRADKVLDKMNDQYYKNLKKFDKDLYNHVDDLAKTHRPFTLKETPAETNYN